MSPPYKQQILDDVCINVLILFSNNSPMFRCEIKVANEALERILAYMHCLVLNQSLNYAYMMI